MGLSPKAWEILDTVCTVEYMGAAEFEHGKLPAILARLWEAGQLRNNLTSFAFNVAPHERVLSWDRTWRGNKKSFPAAQTVTVFGICYASQLEDVKVRTHSFLQEFVPTPGSTCPQFKRPAIINSSFDLDMFPNKEDKYPRSPTTGWIDLDNDFMFFSSAKMWTDFCSLLGVTPCEVPEIIPADYAKLPKPELTKLAVSLGVFRTKTAAGKLPKAELLSLLS